MTRTALDTYKEQQRLLRLCQGLNLLNSGHTLVDVRRHVDTATEDYWCQELAQRTVKARAGTPEWTEWSTARRRALNEQLRALRPTRPTPAPTDPAYGDWIPTTRTTA